MEEDYLFILEKTGFPIGVENIGGRRLLNIWWGKGGGSSIFGGGRLVLIHGGGSKQCS